MNEVETTHVLGNIKRGVLEMNEKEATSVGIVVDCNKLNVRRRPDCDSDVIFTVSALTEVLIEWADTTEGFFKIVTGMGAEGYCLKKFVVVKE